jgi:hypothetical protein
MSLAFGPELVVGGGLLTECQQKLSHLLNIRGSCQHDILVGPEEVLCRAEAELQRDSESQTGVASTTKKLEPGKLTHANKRFLGGVVGEHFRLGAP